MITKFRGIHWSLMSNKEETKKKISKSLTGRIGNRLGKYHTEESKIKMSLTRRGVKKPPRSKEHRKNIGLAHKGLKHSEETKKKMRIAHKGQTSPMKGRKLTKEHSASLRSPESLKKRSGKNHWKWKGNRVEISRRIKTSFEYRQWRSDVFTRDDFTCQDCSIRGGRLEGHHKKRFAVIMDEYKIKTFEQALMCEELWNINNGQTLCKKCHDKTKKFSYE